MNNLVCLCGSTRFVEEYQEANSELTKRGFAVITISVVLPRDGQGNEENPALKEYLDLVHLNKILRADAVFVVGDGYIGKSTAREILWADMLDKPVVHRFNKQSWYNIAFALRYKRGDSSIIQMAKQILGRKAGAEHIYRPAQNQ